jgi:ketosteroid isomerase-like protein
MADEAELKAIVQAVYAHAGAGEWAACEAYLSPDLVIFEADGLPYAGEYRGRDALRRLHGQVMAHWHEPRIDFHAMTAGDGHVVSLVTFHLTSRATGRSVAMPLAECFRIENGQVAEIRPFYFDPAMVGALDR